MKITKHSFGTTKNGQPVTLFRMENAAGAVVEALDYGCILRAIRVPDRNGKLVDVVLGYDTLAEYESHDGYFGAIVGRVAGRISNARFALNEKTYSLTPNDGVNQLHGGAVGFNKYVWDARLSEDGVAFTRCSPNGEEGYPGTLYARVLYTWSDDNVLTLAYEATADADTIVNMTNHSYFNLDGGGTVLEEELTIHAEGFTEMQPGCLTTGRILPPTGTVLDFTASKPIGRDLFCGDAQLACVGGYDHFFVLGASVTGKPRLAAELYAPATGIGMLCKTDQPGIQVYTSNALSERAGKDGASYGQYAAICLEAQSHPDAPSHSNYPSIVLEKGETYRQQTQYAFYVKG